MNEQRKMVDFDPTNPEAFALTSKKPATSTGNYKKVAHHPLSQYYGAFGTVFYFNFGTTRTGHTFKNYNDERELRNLVGNFVDEKRRAKDEQRGKLYNKLREYKRDKYPKYMTDELEAKIAELNEDMIVAYLHEADAYYRSEADYLNDDYPHNISDKTHIRTFKSVEQVENINNAVQPIQTVHGNVWRKWIIV